MGSIIHTLTVGHLYQDERGDFFFYLGTSENGDKCFYWNPSRETFIRFIELDPNDLGGPLFMTDVTDKEKIPAWLRLFIEWATTAILGKENNTVIQKNF